MIGKRDILVFGLLLAVVGPSLHAETGAQLYQRICTQCHVLQGRPTLAPPAFAVRDHVIRAYPDRDAFIQRVVAWVKHPDAERALMPGAVRRFGVMPALQLSDEQLHAAAAFLYDGEFLEPEWYQQHFQAEHGPQKP